MQQAVFDEQAIAAIRGIAMDAPHKARSGHQGTAMALAPLAHVLYSRVMNYDAATPNWPDRDRFVLSAGHASALHYAMLFLAGFGLERDDLADFRQWGSQTPGHPEVGHTAGVEVTTGPLGQGFANGVGMGITERILRSQFGAELCDHYTFVICGDGDLSEGISHEAASLAGHLGLGRLIYVYDDNHVTIDGATELALSDNAAKRFEAYGWHVDNLGEVANDLDALEASLRGAMGVEDKPSLLILRSHIGYPSPDGLDDPHVHGYSLKDDEIKRAKEIIGIPADETFWAPDELVEHYRSVARRGSAKRIAWEGRKAEYSGDLVSYEAALAGRGVPGWESSLPTFEVGAEIATRVASGTCVQAVVDVVPGLAGGGADLTGNTGTTIKDHGVQSVDEPAGRQILFGVREHAMGAILNGMALHGGSTPIGGTFLVFSDYMRGAVRLAALSNAKSVFVWSHDSVGVGEDGPTHQPIEHIAALRAIPNLKVIRPADANETAHAWIEAIDGDGPTALILSRQNVPVLAGTRDGATRKGAYVLSGDESADIVLIGTGSEVAVCRDAAVELAATGIHARVVSMPCWELFERQSPEYRKSVLLSGVPRLSVEAGVTFGWHRFADDTVGIDRFGASAPGEVVMERLGITAEAVADRARSLLAG